MKQQVVFIHWGDSKENYKDFNDYLEKLEYKPFEEKKIKWRHSFKETLWNDFEIFSPEMPNSDFADYEERKIMFKKVIPFLSDNVMLVWHSMWATFLSKYLNENNFQFKIKHIFLIAWAFKNSEMEILGNFSFDKKLTNLKKYENIITLYHSKDDPVVPYSDFEDFWNILTGSEQKIFEDRGHFIDETFPEIFEDIKNI